MLSQYFDPIFLLILKTCFWIFECKSVGCWDPLRSFSQNRIVLGGHQCSQVSPLKFRNQTCKSLGIITWLLHPQVIYQLVHTELLSESCHRSNWEVHLLQNKIVVIMSNNILFCLKKRFWQCVDFFLSFLCWSLLNIRILLRIFIINIFQLPKRRLHI